MKSIAVINFKGGVGKITLSYLLGLHLSESGNKVLLCDIDPQISLTQVIGSQFEFKDLFEHLWNYPRDSKIISDLADLITYYSKNKGIFPKSVYKDTFINLRENLSIIPSSDALYGMEFTIRYDDNTKNFFKRFLPKIPSKFKSDYLIFDCPPTLTPITYSALYEADLFLIPVQLDLFGQRSIEALYNFLENISQLKRQKPSKYAIVYNKVQFSSQKAIVNKSANIKIGIENWIEMHPNVLKIETIIPQRACIEKSLERIDIDNETKGLIEQLGIEITNAI
jgi:chromosome partitioning protein